MPISPTNIIAVSGMIRGSGFQIPSALTNIVASVQSNPLVSGISSLSQSFTVGGVTLPAAIPSLPANLSSIAQLNSTASSVLTQAQSILPAGGADPASGIKSFLSVYSSSTAFGSASAEWSAALTQYSGQSFGDLGINMGNYHDVISNGATSISRGFGALVQQQQAQAFGSLGSVLSPSALASGAAALKSSTMSNALQSLGGGLKNFGTLFNFSSPTSLGPKNLITNLQKQGLCDRTGINDAIMAAGYDPTNISQVPDSVLTNILSQVQGSDLTKILSQTGARPTVAITDASGLLQASNMLPPQVVQALGLANRGLGALPALGSTLSNLGTSIDNFKMSDLMSGIETKSMQYLGQLQQLIPSDVSTSMKSILGTGGGLFGNPQLTDMLGTVSGTGHTTNLTSAVASVAQLASTTSAQGLITAGAAYKTAVQTFLAANPGSTSDAVLADPTVAAALSAAQSAATTLNSTVGGNSGLQTMMSGVTASVAASTAQLGKEVQNLSLAGLKMVSDSGSAITQSFNSGYQSIMNFGSRLHGLGVDRQQLGHNDILPQMCTADSSGDAIQASLVEGRNIDRAAAANQPPAAVADERATISAASSSNLDALKVAYLAAARKADLASKDLFNIKAGDPRADAINTAYEAAVEESASAKSAMLQAAQAAGVSASSLPEYRSNGSFN